MKRILAIAIPLLLIAAGIGGWWYMQDDSVDVEFSIQMSTDNGCSGVVPGYGFVTSHAEIVLRNNDNEHMATVPLVKSSATGASFCHMIGQAEAGKAEVYKATFESNGGPIPIGLIDWEDLKDGSVTLVNP